MKHSRAAPEGPPSSEPPSPFPAARRSGEAALERAREVVRTEAAAVAGFEARLGPSFVRAVALLRDCRGRVVVTGMGKPDSTLARHADVALDVRLLLRVADVMVPLDQAGRVGEAATMREAVLEMSAHRGIAHGDVRDHLHARDRGRRRSARRHGAPARLHARRSRLMDLRPARTHRRERFAVRSVKGLGAGLCAWFLVAGCQGNELAPRRPLTTQSDPQERVPDQIIEQGTHIMTREGVKKAVMTARRIFFYNVEGKVESDSVRVTFFDVNGVEQSWLNADHGEIDQRTNDMTARGNVLVVSKDGSRIQGDELRYDATRDLIVSDKPVTIFERNNRIQGKGVEADPALTNIRMTGTSAVLESKPRGGGGRRDASPTARGVRPSPAAPAAPALGDTSGRPPAPAVTVPGDTSGDTDRPAPAAPAPPDTARSRPQGPVPGAPPAADSSAAAPVAPAPPRDPASVGGEAAPDSGG